MMNGCDETSSSLSICNYDRIFLECSWRWLNDPIVKKMTMTPDFSQAAQEKWFKSLPSKNDYAVFGVSAGGEKIGACGLKNITSTDAEYWGYIGESRFWGRGFGRQLVSAMMELARERGLTSLWLKVSIDNERAVRLYERMGFSKISDADGIYLMAAKVA